MRPQLNVSLDEYPELPDKIRKLCKVRGYKISDFCARVLNAAIDKEVAEMAGNTSEPLSQVSIEVVKELRELEGTLNKLGDAFNESVPNLITDVWLLRQAVFEGADPLVNRVKQLEESLSELRTHLGGLKKAEASSEDDSTSDTPKFKCSNCGAVGLVGQKFKPAGSSKGKKRHLCLSCGEKITNLIEVK